MYEENVAPLSHHDGNVVFAEQLDTLRRAGLATPAPAVTPETVVRWADRSRLPAVVSICRRLLLPGSRLHGVEHLRELVELAQQGQSCLLCLNHRSTLDVPTLYTLLEDQSDPAMFERIIWISGRKLEEDEGMTSALVQCVNRIIVTPNTWFETERNEKELRQARLVNIAAERAVVSLRDQGWVFALFPAGTRTRLDDPTTRRAIEQVHGYLDLFDYLLLANIDGCTMPVSRDHDLSRESPRLDKVVFRFGPIRRTEDWVREAVARYPDLNSRSARARAITDEIERLQAEQSDN